MPEKLTCQVCTAILIKTKINGITVYECPICGQSSIPSNCHPQTPPCHSQFNWESIKIEN